MESKNSHLHRALCLLIGGLALPVLSCSSSSPVQGCDTYGVTGYCFEGGFPISPLLRADVCADSLAEASSVGTKALQNREKCSIGGVTPTLFRTNFCTLNGQSCTPASNETALMGYRSPSATFDGVVDPNLSWVFLKNVEDGDSETVKVQGEISIIGGNCLGSSCPFEISYVSLKAAKEFYLSGKRVTEMSALNHGVWTGQKHSDDSFTIGVPSFVSLSGRLDGSYISVRAQSQSHVAGAFKIANRAKEGGSVPTTALTIKGEFLEQHVFVKMHLHLWMADCRPEAVAHVSCVVDPDGIPYGVRIDALQGKMIGNSQQQDLCNAIRDQKFQTVCGSDEFKFQCFQGPDPTSGNLSYRWEDGQGDKFGENPFEDLRNCPTFPMKLTVTNEWGHVATKTIWDAPGLGKCADLCRPTYMIDESYFGSFRPIPMDDMSGATIFDPATCEERAPEDQRCLAFEEYVTEKIEELRPNR